MNSATYQPRLLIIRGGVPFNSPFILNPKELQSSKGKNRFQGLSWYIETTLPIASLKFISPYSYPKEHPMHRRKEIDFKDSIGLWYIETKLPIESLKSISPTSPKRHNTRRRDWDLFPIPSQCNVQNHCKWVVPGSKAQMDMLPISYWRHASMFGQYKVHST